MIKLHEALENAFDTFESGEFTTSTLDRFIRVRRESVLFQMQSGNVNDFGVNGVQCEEMLKFVHSYLSILNSHVGNAYNQKALAHINEAILALDMRTADRVKRGVEGTHQT